MMSLLACLHQWGPWIEVSTKIRVRQCDLCGAAQEQRR